jgi:glutaredoxin-like protein NrdH
MSLGHVQAPVVVADGRHWAGFRPDEITELAHRAAGAGRGTAAA